MNLSLTVIANMTSNYGEGLGNISSVQKSFRNGKTYGIRSKESLKNAIMVNSGMYDDVKVSVDTVAQKAADEKLNASNCRALEAGYMNTAKGGNTYKRNSSFYLTDAVSCDEYVNESRFHNNLYLATARAKAEGVNLQSKSEESGQMIYQFELDRGLKIYSLTINLDMIGKDDNFKVEASAEEKADRVCLLLDAVAELNLVVKGNLDNAEPVFIVGDIIKRRTHYFENVVKAKDGSVLLSDELKSRAKTAGLLKSGVFKNEEEISSELNTVSVDEFFEDLKRKTREYYGV